MGKIQSNLFRINTISSESTTNSTDSELIPQICNVVYRMLTFTMRDAVNDYLEASGANRPSIGGEETILAHRKIAANRLAIDCIYALSKEELSKVDRELGGIVGDLPRQGHWMNR